MALGVRRASPIGSAGQYLDLDVHQMIVVAGPGYNGCFLRRLLGFPGPSF